MSNLTRLCKKDYLLKGTRGQLNQLFYHLFLSLALFFHHRFTNRRLFRCKVPFRWHFITILTLPITTVYVLFVVGHLQNKMSNFAIQLQSNPPFRYLNRSAIPLSSASFIQVGMEHFSRRKYRLLFTHNVQCTAQY